MKSDILSYNPDIQNEPSALHEDNIKGMRFYPALCIIEKA